MPIDANFVSVPIVFATNTIIAGASGSGRLIDTSATQIAALTQRSNGARVWVVSVLDSFHWNPLSTLTADNITIVNPTANGANPGRFIRDHIPAIEWENALTFFVDFTNGNDEYDGSVQTFTANLNGPLKTYDEYVRRVAGHTGVIRPRVAQVVNQVGDYITAGTQANFIVDAVYNGGTWTLQGVLPAASFTGTISAKTDLSAAADAFTAATSTWTVATELFRLVKNTTKGFTAWVTKDNGGASAELSAWSTVDLTTGVAPVLGNSAVNDSISTFILPKLGSLMLQVLGGNGTVAAALVQVNNLDLTGVQGRNKFIALGQTIVLNNIRFTTNTERNSIGIIYNNCLHAIAGASSFVTNGASGNFIFNAGALALGTYTFSGGGVIFTSRQFALTQCAVIVSAGTTFNVNNMGARNCLAPAVISLQGRSRLRIDDSLWGITGNAGFGVYVNPGSTILEASAATPNLTLAGATAQISFAGNLTAPAWNAATNLYILPNRNITWALINTTVAGGGFGNWLFDPQTGCAAFVDL